MKKYCIILLLFFLNPLFSQIYRFEYDLKVLKDTLSTNYSEFQVAVEISPEQKKFYDLYEYKNDSIHGSNTRLSLGFDQRLIKDRKSDNALELHKINGGYFSIKQKDIIIWKIHKETKKISDYAVQKATCIFGGRKWTAWFTREIPINEGPYKFGGLPGMILEVADSANHYQYRISRIIKLAESSKTNNILETDYGNKPFNINLDQYKKLYLDYFADPFINFKNQGSFPININGITYNKYEDLIPARSNIQSIIKKNNNPVEREKSIPYPIK